MLCLMALFRSFRSRQIQMPELAFWTTTMELIQAVGLVILAISNNFSIQSSSDLTLFFIAIASHCGG